MVAKEEDLQRNLYKSETCGLKIPELEIEMSYGSLGGVYSTVEGLVIMIKENL